MKKNYRTFLKFYRPLAALTALFCMFAAGTILILDDFSRRAVIIAATLVLLTAGLLLFMHMYLITPLRKMLSSFRRYSSGEKENMDFAGAAYFPELYRAIKKASLAVQKEEMLRLSLEQSKYLALQNQINPHFLYNALDAIRGDALEAGIHGISETTEALSTFFRYSISNMEKIATVREELANVNDFITVQKFRFGSRLEYSVIAPGEDSGIYSLSIPRLSLQPLVENAISHGFKNKTGAGIITVCIQRTQKELQIEVSDNGVGMDAEKLSRLNGMFSGSGTDEPSVPKDTKGIALNNVDSRIKLIFGKDYGLHIFSEKNVGTRVRMLLPVIHEDNYYENRVFEN